MGYEIHKALHFQPNFLILFCVLVQFQEADVARILDEQIAKRFSFLKDDDLEYAKLKSMERVESSLERRDNFNGYQLLISLIFVLILRCIHLLA